MADDPRDIEIKRLQTMLAEREAVIADRDAKIEQLARQIDLLSAHVERLLRGRSRGSSVPEGQGLLFDGSSVDVGDDATDASPEESVSEAGEPGGEQAEGPPAPPKESKDKPKRGASRGRKIDTTGLPRETQVQELPVAERICPVTGLMLVAVGVKIIEELDYKRAKLVVVEHHQTIYGLSLEDAEERQAATIAAPVPGRPIANCIASAMLLSWLLVQKYANHLPLYRQTNIFGRDGLCLPRQTLCDWALAAAEAMEPIVDHMLARVRAGPVLQIDDTPVKCQGGRGESNFQARLWAFVNPAVSGVVYRFTPGRASDTLAIELGNFVGTLVGDGYSGNHAAAKLIDARRRESEGDDAKSIVLGGCWAHGVRKFREAEKEDEASAKLFRSDFRELYAVEAEAQGIVLDDERDRSAITLDLRTRKSRSVVIRILRRTSRMRFDFDEAGLLGKAIKYIRNQRSSLLVFLRDGSVPIDNNACERAIRPIAVGRRNWLFTGSMRGGRAAAIAYTLIESCKHADVDPVDYFADVLGRVADQPTNAVSELVPANWAPIAAADAAKRPATAGV